ncbi:helix-turn-helix domain-containing protein [Bradyrhizobium australafricanum]|uniref:helix-turn-helix domain-containing protein n=1 Tax=Bradyrhizobium australafricanum TaxID=2821406 RepID=UPI001CE3068F|nr:AraC family transcriptional regulator [Bradyrhizobium australafricanum]MCA6100083.1 helix-turn-helix transcriptional regulator [Bradyrhizobium australafricanum]
MTKSDRCRASNSVCPCQPIHDCFGLRALADDPADKRRLDDWAILAGSPVRTLTRRFPIETGFSFTEWRQRVRLMRALEMLADEIPVTTIALDLGYETVSAFIALFRRTFRTTPARYFPRAPARQR